MFAEESRSNEGQRRVAGRSVAGPTTAPTTEDPQGKVVGLTNVHVVCPPVAGETNLQISVADLTSVEFSTAGAETVTPGTLVLLEIHDVPEPYDLLYSALYTAGAADTPETIAQGLVKRNIGRAEGRNR